jgi:hypothetical protein
MAGAIDNEPLVARSDCHFHPSVASTADHRRTESEAQEHAEPRVGPAWLPRQRATIDQTIVVTTDTASSSAAIA